MMGLCGGGCTSVVHVTRMTHDVDDKRNQMISELDEVCYDGLAEEIPMRYGFEAKDPVI